jgi:hyaluronan synthase
MAHASGWGTRAGAYSGGATEISSEEEIARHSASDSGPSAPSGAGSFGTGSFGTAGAASLRTAPQLQPAVGGLTTATALATRTQLPTRAEARTASTAVTAKARRRLNPLAVIPYLIGIAILTLEALFLV